MLSVSVPVRIISSEQLVKMLSMQDFLHPGLSWVWVDITGEYEFVIIISS